MFFVLFYVGTLIAVYTPNANVSACEMTCNGRFVVLALEGHKNLLTLQLRGRELQGARPPHDPYGDAANEGKLFEVKDSEGPC